MNLNEAIEKTDGLLIIQRGNLRKPFLNIGLVEKDSLSSRIQQGPLYDLIKIFDDSKSLLKDHGLEEKSKEGIVYIIKTLSTADAMKISKLFDFHNIKNAHHYKYVLLVPFDNKKINLFSRYSFQKYGGVSKEDLEEKVKQVDFSNIESVPEFDQFIAPYLKDKPLPRSTS